MSRPPLRHGKKSRFAAEAEPWHHAEHAHLIAHAQANAQRIEARERLKRLRRQIMVDDLIAVRESELRQQSL